MIIRRQSQGLLGRYALSRHRVQLIQSSPMRFNSSNSSPLGNDRWWIIGALSVVVPGAYWIYHNHYGQGAASSHQKPDKFVNIKDAITHSEAILVDSVKDLELPDVSTNFERMQAGSVPASYVIQAHHIRAKYLLVGGGIASFAAMEEILRLDPHADILIVGDEMNPPYLRAPLSKEIWFNDDEESAKKLEFVDWHGQRKPIFFKPLDFYETHNVELPGGKPRLILGKRAVALDAQNKLITLDDGRKVEYEKLLIATGGRPKLHPSLAQAPLDLRSQFSTFRNVEDYHRIVELLEAGKHIAIVGGGFLGSELAVALAQYSANKLNGLLKISQIFTEDGTLATVFPRYLSRWTTSRIAKAGVDIHPNSQIVSLSVAPESNSGHSRQLKVTLSDGKQLIVDHIISAVGISPNVELAATGDLELDSERGGIITNSELMVRNDIFAAGDVISYYDLGLGLRRRVEHYDNAFLSGRVAGANMVNGSKSIPYNNQSIFWSELGPEVGFEAVGLVDARLTTVGVWSEATDHDSPRAAELDPSDIRAQMIGDISNRSVPAGTSTSNGLQEPVVKSPSGEKTYGKGVVFYIKDRRIVGMVMFNVFNRYALAVNIIQQKKNVEDLQELIELFNINEHRTVQ